MTTTSETPSRGLTLKDLVVTTAVATVVSALVSPWLRRWTEPQEPTAPPEDPPPETAPDDLGAQLERLLEVPNSFPTTMTSPRGERGFGTSRRTDDDDSDDLEP